VRSATAVSALKSLPLFQNTSLRLLSDVAALSEGKTVDRHHTPTADAALLAVVEGVVGLDIDGSDLGPFNARRGSAVMPNQTCPKDRKVHIHAHRPARVRWLKSNDLVDCLRASPALLRSLDSGVVSQLMPDADRASSRCHLMWLAAEPGFDLPLEAFAFLLAAAIAQQFHERTSVAVLDEKQATLHVWRDGRFRAPEDLVEPPALLASVAANDCAHLVVVHPRNSHVPPVRFEPLRFHRIVELARKPASVVPPALRRLLKRDVLALRPPHRKGDHDAASHGEPYLSAFVSTVLLSKVPAGHEAAPHTEKAALDDTDEEETARTPGVRLRRDLCRLRLDPSVIARHARHAGRSSADLALALLAGPEDDTIRASLLRWARAVTNRRVGIAISGGGASMYRVLPLLRALHEARVPIDVVSGISGGAVLGAYYAHQGLAGLDRCMDQRGLFQLAIAIGVVDTAYFGRLVDADLGGTTLDELEVTFVPCATALKPNGPEPHVVTAGSLGEAVRISGSLPLLLAPLDKGDIRYADGALSTLVPSRVLRDFGADMVIAINCVPGATQRNPFSSFPFGEFLYRRTPAGRLIDLWISTAGLLQRVSREAGENAHVFIEADNVVVPLVESFTFYDGQRLADEAAATIGDHVDEVRDFWKRFSR
jgi:predicted acylesterase/phospholipase RssA